MKEISKLFIYVENGKLPLTVVRGNPAGSAVLMIPSAFGVAPDVERQLVEIAGTASIAVAMDLFFREDPGVVPYDDMPRVFRRVQGLNHERCRQDIRAALAWARAQSRGKPLVALGVCMGGVAALRLAADNLVDGVVTWHGSFMEHLLNQAGEMRCPMRHHFGEVDPFVKPEVVDAVRKAFEGHDNVQVFVHDGATHGFSHPDSKDYNRAAERAAMASVHELVANVARMDAVGATRSHSEPQIEPRP